MRIFLFLLILTSTLPCFAQKDLLKTGAGLKAAFGKNAAENLLKNARVVQGKILLDGMRVPSVSTSVPVSAVEKYVFRPVELTPLNKMQLSVPVRTQDAFLNAAYAYRSTMAEFKKFKKEMDPVLYYQSKPNERRTLSDAERAELMRRIMRMISDLRELTYSVSPNDPALSAAREYCHYAMETISPTLRGFVRGPHEPVREDREFVKEEFFMRTPAGKEPSFWDEFLSDKMLSRRAARKLPGGLKMAVLNDRKSVLDRMQQLHGRYFCPDWEIYTYEKADDLLDATRTQGLKFDVILADIIVEGGGGFYVTSSLRHEGFKGLIFAATSYRENEGFALEMFERGMDGMFSLPKGFEDGADWPWRIMQGLDNYFYYRNLHGWSR